MTTYRDQDDLVTTDDETQVHASEPYEEPPAFQPPVASNDYHPEDLQRRRFGGPNWGAGFFGWLVMVAVGVLLSAAVSAAVLALGASDDVLPTEGTAPDTTMAGAAVLLGILLLSYFSGGYVAGRMSRFDGGKQGVAVWVTGLLLAGGVVGLALLFGPEVRPLVGLMDRLNLPALQLSTTASGVTPLAVAVGALAGGLLAAVLGGKVGCRYHRKVDDAAYV